MSEGVHQLGRIAENHDAEAPLLYEASEAGEAAGAAVMPMERRLVLRTQGTDVPSQADTYAPSGLRPRDVGLRQRAKQRRGSVSHVRIEEAKQVARGRSECSRTGQGWDIPIRDSLPVR